MAEDSIVTIKWVAAIVTGLASIFGIGKVRAARKDDRLREVLERMTNVEARIESLESRAERTDVNRADFWRELMELRRDIKLILERLLRDDSRHTGH